MADTLQTSLIKLTHFVHDKFQLKLTKDGICYHSALGSKDQMLKIFGQLTFPKLSTLDKMNKLDDRLLVITVSSEDRSKYIGTIVFNYRKKEALEMKCFNINPAFRNQGFGQQVMDNLKKVLKQSYVRQVYCQYRSYWKSDEYWTSILDKSGWSPAELKLHYFSLPDYRAYSKMDFFENLELPAPYKVEDWNDTTFSQLEKELAKPDWQDLVRKELNPFQLKDLVLPHVSLLLKKGEEIVGWIIFHELQSDVAQATTLFIRKDKAKGMGLFLFSEVAKRRRDNRRLVWIIEKDNHKMLNMARKYILDNSIEMTANLSRRWMI